MAITTAFAEFLEDFEDGKQGNAFHIPNPYTRMGAAFTLRPQMFTLVGSTSGVGKSSFIDDMFVLKPWRMLVSKSDMVHWEVMYYSMERHKRLKVARWLAWLLFIDHGILISATDLLGYGENKISDSLYKIVKGYGDEMERLLELVTIYDGRITVSQLRDMLVEKALSLGRYFVSDSDQYWEITRTGTSVTSQLDQVKQVKRGKKLVPVKFASFDVDGQTKTITSNSFVYVPDNPHTLVQVVLDGVGLIDTTAYGGNVKKAVDAVTNVLADVRDRFKFSPVMVSQFNRGIADSQRVKNQGSNQGPQESDFKDSGNTYQAADLVIGLFDPYKHKAYDKDGFFAGYDLDRMKAPRGFSRFRSAHILKNSFGFADLPYGLKYVGESSYFETLPLPSDPRIYDMYAEIAAGK